MLYPLADNGHINILNIQACLNDSPILTYQLVFPTHSGLKLSNSPWSTSPKWPAGSLLDTSDSKQYSSTSTSAGMDKSEKLRSSLHSVIIHWPREEQIIIRFNKKLALLLSAIVNVPCYIMKRNKYLRLSIQKWCFYIAFCMQSTI